MSHQRVSRILVLLAFVGCAAPAVAQQVNTMGQLSNPYGLSIALETAMKIAPAALAEARKNGWTMAVAVVDTHGELVYFEKMDNTQLGSGAIAVAKARAAARFKRPTKLFQDMLATGGDQLRVLGLEGAVPVEGGFPLVIDGKIVGAVGVSGGTSPQDSQCAKIAADMLK